MESNDTSCFVLFSMNRLVTLRSPSTTSADVDQILSTVLDEWVGGTRTAEEIIGRKITSSLGTSSRSVTAPSAIVYE